MTTPKKDDNSKRQEPRRLGEQSINMSPEKQNTSQIPMTNQQEELKKEEEEEKLNAEDLAEQQKRLQMMHDLVQLQRSDYISPVELGYLQGNFMKELQVGGLFGLDTVPLDKTLLFKHTPGEGVPLIQAEPKRDFLKKDGIFTSASEFSLPQVEIQRLEQRLIWENRKEWFRPDNGKLVMDTEFFEERITTMRDTETSKNPNLITFQRNAYLSERQNQKKNQYYKLDLIIGKLTLTNHPLFCEEDRLAALLKTQVREFKEKSDLALIPHLRVQIEQLKLERDNMNVRYDVPQKQMEIIDKEILLHETLLEQEEKELQALAEKIYHTWGEIQNVRKRDKCVSTTVKLNVRQYMSEEDTKELDLFITHQNTDNVATNKLLSNAERHRRQRIQQNRVYLRIFINDNYVCRTKKAFIDWPSMEVTFLEKFQVFLFTKPGSIKLQVVMGTFREQTIETVELDIPGETVNTLTSSSILYREKDFKRELSKTIKKPTDPKDQAQQQQQQPPIASPNKGDKKEEEKKDGKENQNKVTKPKVEYIVKKEVTHSGIINYKAEWHGTGNTFPPPAIDKFGVVKHGGIKMKTARTIDEVIDLNDPRNETLIEQLRQLKNKQLQDLLNRDAKMPLAELDSLRHRILRLRHQKLALTKRKIPITEGEIFQSDDFMKILRDEEEEIQKFLQDEFVFSKGMMLKDQALDVDRPPESPETKMRIKNIRRKLYRLSQETLKDKQKDLSSHLSLKSVVNEFYFEEDTDPIAEFIKSLFEQRGKLRPKKKAQDKVSAKRTNQTDILIHCVKGTNVPVRAKAYMIVQALKAGGFTPNSFGLRTAGQGYGNNMVGYNGPDNMMGASQYGGMPGMNMSGGFGNMNPNASQPLPQNVRGMMEQNPLMKGAIAGGTPTDTLEIERVLSFMEVTLYNPETGQSIVVKTETFEGISPEWNDNLTIPYKAFNDEGFEMKELLETNSILYFTLFDMVGVIQKQDKALNNFNISIEKRFLGSFQIPLVTLFQNPKMDAQFKVDRPLFLLGYFNMKANAFSASEIVTDPSQPTHVTLSIGLNPVIEIPSRNESDYYGGAENPDLLLRGSAWIKHLKENSKFANKNIRLWAENINKKAKLESHFLPRYLTPLKPPFDAKSEDAYNQCARFVSLIPFKSDAEAFKDVPDIWSTCQEFLDLKGGDSEEHAILLCCYFMYLDEQQGKADSMKNYLIIGKGVPEGDTVYVLRKNVKNDDIEIWNATAGDPYYFKRIVKYNQCCYLKLNKTSQIDIEVSDTICPLKEVTCLVNNENVWVNIQEDVSPNTVLFDIQNTSHWVPFLDDKMKKEYFKDGKIESIQPELHYDDIDDDYCNMLQHKLETELRKRLTNYRASDDEGRSPHPTQYDDVFGKHVRDEMLKSFEFFKYNTRTTGIHSPLNPKTNTQESIKQIQLITDRILALVDHTKCDVFGIPLNMPYLGVERIWQMVKNTDIMNIDSPDVKYVLEVAVHPYPHFVNSVWVYVGVIFTKPIK